MTQTYSGIIFDFNGVLLWDTPLHEDVWREFARRLRDEPFGTDEMRARMHGRHNHEILEYLLGHSLTSEEAERLSEEKEELYRVICREMGDAYQLSPGAIDLLEVLVAHDIPRTIATGSNRGNVSFYTQQLGLDRWFEVAKIVYDDGTIPGKPAPDIYLRAADTIGLSPAQCIVVEDSLSGIEAARRAGIGYILALSTSSPRATLVERPGVAQVIDSLEAFDTTLLLNGTTSRR